MLAIISSNNSLLEHPTHGNCYWTFIYAFNELNEHLSYHLLTFTGMCRLSGGVILRRPAQDEVMRISVIERTRNFTGKTNSARQNALPSIIPIWVEDSL